VVGGHPASVVVPAIAVPDLAGALATVRAAGGESSGIEQRHYGRVADCHDDQGALFQLLQR
jgi:predicted enzyme related to lactoylglutathione lyase